MRSLAVKLTLAFVLVAVAGVGLVAVVMRLYTQRQFNKLILDQNQQFLVAALTRFYEINRSWQGVEVIFRPGGLEWTPQNRSEWRWETRRVLFVIADSSGNIVFGEYPNLRTRRLNVKDLRKGIPLQHEGKIVGWLIFAPALDRWNLDTPEGNFLLGVQRVLLFSALVAVGIALLLGGVLAYTLTRALRELTTAAQEISKGKLGLQVEVRSKDELGKLAAAFNQMSAELARSIELRRRMTADIAHDLRTPLSVILGYTEALADGKLNPDAEMLTVIHNEALHLSRLIDDLKVISLADAGELSLNLQLIDPHIILRRAAEAYRIQAEQKQITIRLDLPPEAPPIRVDVDRMAQVLGNLMSNALRYTPPGGEITLAVEVLAREVALLVADTGKGIPPEDLPYIFERAFRGDKARARENGETGLGLAIVKSLVEAQGGRVSVQSAPGAGTQFRCVFPI